MGYALVAQNHAELSAVAQPEGLPSPLSHTWSLAPWGSAPWDVSESLQEVLQPQLSPLFPPAETGPLKGAKEDMR